MIIALTGQKGGSSKSTVAMSIASEWHKRGARVLLVDADNQASIRMWGETGAELGRSMPTIVGMGPNLDAPDQVPTLARNYDIVVIDCPPGFGPTQRSALMVADLAILPCAPSSLDIQSLGESVSFINECRTKRPELKSAILVSRTVTGTRLAKTAREAFANFHMPILTTQIGYRVAYQEAPAAGLGVTGYAPGSAAAAEICVLCGEIEAMLDRRKQNKLLPFPAHRQQASRQAVSRSEVHMAPAMPMAM